MTANETLTKKTAKHGFTLVEMLAVMAVILILSMIAFRVATYVGMKARLSKAEADMYKWTQAFQQLHDFVGHYYIRAGGRSRDWFNRYRDGVPRYDPWGNAYSVAVFNPRSGERLPGENEGAAAMQEYIVFSLGPDGAPGYRGVNDDYDDDNYPYREDDRWEENLIDEYSRGEQISEIGYGDDIVTGQHARKRGFPPGRVSTGL